MANGSKQTSHDHLHRESDRPELPNHGVKLPAAGVKVRVLQEKGTSLKVKFN